MPSDLRAALGRTVRLLRTQAGYSQEGFADAIGVHRTYMGTLERGNGNPTLETLQLICVGLGVSVSDLLHAAESGRLPDVPARNPARPLAGKRGRRPPRDSSRS